MIWAQVSLTKISVCILSTNSLIRFLVNQKMSVQTGILCQNFAADVALGNVNYLLVLRKLVGAIQDCWTINTGMRSSIFAFSSRLVPLADLTIWSPRTRKFLCSANDVFRFVRFQKRFVGERSTANVASRGMTFSQMFFKVAFAREAF